jgi:hypothetical protein
MNQAILFEDISKNTSNYFKFPNSGISDFNPSLNAAPYVDDPLSESTNLKFFPEGVPELFYTTMPFKGYPASVYTTGDTAFNFLTCHGFSKSNRVSVYLEPFDRKIWITVLSITTCLILVLTMTYWFFKGSQGHRTTLPVYILNSTCYNISVLLENGYGTLHIPTHRKHVGNGVFLILAFISIILGSLYKSIITTDMISPILGSIPYDNFSQLHNFTLVVKPSTDLRVVGRDLEPNKKNTEIERNGIGLLDKGVHVYESSDFKNYWNSIEPTHANASEDEINHHANIIQGTRVFEHEEDALAQLATCSKIAFVGSTEEIQDFEKFNQNRIKLGRGKVKFLLHSFYLIIPDSARGFLRRRMAGLLNSGIWHVWAKAFYAKTRDDLEPGLKKTIEIKQGLDTNLGALFQIYAFAAVFAVAVFTTEIIYSLFRKLVYHLHR